MKTITYNPSDLSLKEKNMREITYRIDTIMNAFKSIQCSIDTDIKYRDNIYNNLNTIQRDMARLSEHTYRTSRFIHQAVSQYTHCERQLQNTLNQLSATDRPLPRLPITNIIATHPLIDQLFQRWMKVLSNKFSSQIVHLKDFFRKGNIQLHNKNAFASKNSSLDNEYDAIRQVLKKIPELNNRLHGRPYSNQYIIMEIENYIVHQGKAINIAGKPNFATLNALKIRGIHNLNINKTFVQGNSYWDDRLNIHAYDNSIVDIDPWWYKDTKVDNKNSNHTNISNIISNTTLYVDKLSVGAKEVTQYGKDFYSTAQRIIDEIDDRSSKVKLEHQIGINKTFDPMIDKLNTVGKVANVIGNIADVVDTTNAIIKEFHANDSKGATTSEYISDVVTEVASTGINNASKASGAWVGAKSFGAIGTYIGGPVGGVIGATAGGIAGAIGGDKLSKNLLNKEVMSNTTKEIIDNYTEDRKKVIEKIEQAESVKEATKLSILDSLKQNYNFIGY